MKKITGRMIKEIQYFCDACNRSIHSSYEQHKCFKCKKDLCERCAKAVDIFISPNQAQISYSNIHTYSCKECLPKDDCLEARLKIVPAPNTPEAGGE